MRLYVFFEMRPNDESDREPDGPFRPSSRPTGTGNLQSGYSCLGHTRHSWGPKVPISNAPGLGFPLRFRPR